MEPKVGGSGVMRPGLAISLYDGVPLQRVKGASAAWLETWHGSA